MSSFEFANEKLGVQLLFGRPAPWIEGTPHLQVLYWAGMFIVHHRLVRWYESFIVVIDGSGGKLWGFQSKTLVRRDLRREGLVNTVAVSPEFIRNRIRNQ